MYDLPTFGGGILGSQAMGPTPQPSMGLMDPRTQGLLGLSAALLQASGPSRTPVSFGQVAGQGLMGGMQGYQAGRQGQMQELSYAMQMQKLKKDLEAQSRFDQMYGSGATAPNLAPSAAAGPTAPGMSPSTSQFAFGTPEFATPPEPQSAPQQTGPTLAQIGQLGAFDAPRAELALKIWQQQNPNLEFSGGVPRNPRTGQVVEGAPVMPQTNQQGFSTTPKWNPQTKSFEIGITPGSMAAFTAQQDATQRAQANYKPFLGVTDSSGKPIPMTESQFADTYNPKPQAQSLPSLPPIVPTGFAATEADALKRVQEASKRGEISTITVDPSKAGGMGMSSPQRTALETAGKGDAERVQALESKIPSLLSVQRRLDRMESLTKDDKTYAAAGAELKSMLGSVAQSFGLSVNKDKTANTEEYLAHVAELLKDRLASKDYGSGTGVSNLDMLSAQKPLPELAKTAQGRLQLIQALRSDAQGAVTDAQAARDYFDSNSGLRGFRFPSEVNAENQKKTDDLKRITTPGAPAPTGKVLRYNPATKRIE